MKNYIVNEEEAIANIGDRDIYLEVAYTFGNFISTYVEQLSVALTHQDLYTIKRITHSIKSNCATIGATDLRKLFADMEELATQNNLNALQVTLPQTLISLTELKRNIDNLSKE